MTALHRRAESCAPLANPPVCSPAGVRMPLGPQLHYKRKRGRPANDQSCTAEALLAEIRGRPDLARNPILAALDIARTHHKARKFAETSAALAAATYLAEYAQAAVQLDLLGSPLETCDCGHPRAAHVDGGDYCSICLGKINGDGFHGCKAFRSLADVAVTAGPRSLRCNCGRVALPWSGGDRQDKSYPRTHTGDKSKACYELRPDGVGGRMIRHALDVLPVEAQNDGLYVVFKSVSTACAPPGRICQSARSRRRQHAAHE